MNLNFKSKRRFLSNRHGNGQYWLPEKMLRLDFIMKVMLAIFKKIFWGTGLAMSHLNDAVVPLVVQRRTNGGTREVVVGSK